MPSKSAASNIVRKSAGDISPPTPEHLTHLLATMDGPIDTSEIPETKGPTRRVKRDVEGRLPKRSESPLRSAILAALKQRQMTRYQLWQNAHAYCETLTASAVYEYLRGQRDIGVPYVEALMKAAGLVVRPQNPGRPKKTKKSAPLRRRAAKVSAG
jgi:hypothetical protein